MPNKDNKFHKLVGGYCDGLGCGWSGLECFCEAHLQSCEAYQKKYNKPWINPWEEGGEECRIWDDAWRYSWKLYIEEPAEKAAEIRRAAQKAHYEK